MHAHAYQILSRVLMNFFSVKSNNMKLREIKWRIGHKVREINHGSRSSFSWSTTFDRLSTIILLKKNNQKAYILYRSFLEKLCRTLSCMHNTCAHCIISSDLLKTRNPIIFINSKKSRFIISPGKMALLTNWTNLKALNLRYVHVKSSYYKKNSRTVLPVLKTNDNRY